jgi:DNA-binding NarL/FixJ family response regulator
MGSKADTRRKRVISVLICDDNDAMRTLLRVGVELRPGMCVVGEAADGNEAIVEAIRLQPDVILLDLAMPVRTGLDALVDLRRLAPDAKIVVLSGFATSSVGEQALALGATRYLEKGADTETIGDAIAEVVATVAQLF